MDFTVLGTGYCLHLPPVNSAGMNLSCAPEETAGATRLRGGRASDQPSSEHSISLRLYRQRRVSVGAESGSVFFTDVRYDTQGREEVKGAKVVIARKALLSAVAEWIGSRRRRRSKGSTIGIEAEHLTVAERKRLTDLLPGAGGCGRRLPRWNGSEW